MTHIKGNGSLMAFMAMVAMGCTENAPIVVGNPDAGNNEDVQQPREDCDNATDDDGDGLIDCSDPDCASYRPCSEGQDAGVDVPQQQDGGTDANDMDAGEEDAGPAGECRDSADCDDEDACTTQSCILVGGVATCVVTDRVVCDDLVACTRSSCDRGSGACVHIPDDRECLAGKYCSDELGCVNCLADAHCADRFACNGEEVCGVDGYCHQGTPVSCAPNFRCDEPVGNCVDRERFDEVCGDGVDNDGDGAVDEDGGLCLTAEAGIPGVVRCSDLRCIAAEACNGSDDDGDGARDNGYQCAALGTTPCTTGCGSTGMQDCSEDCHYDICAPPAETCNGRDDDCDGNPDDGFTCVAGFRTECRTACGTIGEQTCSDGCEWGVCVPPVEVCNGINDDCVAGADDRFTCVMGSTMPCITPCGSPGISTCLGDCSGYSACAAPAEVCNGADDDCDGEVDEGDCALPTPESCNAVDDDGDGAIDNGPGMECIRGTIGSCATGCGSVGTRVCGNTCVWDACVPPAESCNGVDDNCDGVIDEGNVCPLRCSWDPDMIGNMGAYPTGWALEDGSGTYVVTVRPGAGPDGSDAVEVTGDGSSGAFYRAQIKRIFGEFAVPLGRRVRMEADANFPVRVPFSLECKCDNLHDHGHGRVFMTFTPTVAGGWDHHSGEQVAGDYDADGVVDADIAADCQGGNERCAIHIGNLRATAAEPYSFANFTVQTETCVRSP